MKIYLFNVTNAENWLNGLDSKLKVKQVGPFIYKELWTKSNITFHRLEEYFIKGYIKLLLEIIEAQMHLKTMILVRDFVVGNDPILFGGKPLHSGPKGVKRRNNSQMYFNALDFVKENHKIQYYLKNNNVEDFE